MEERHRTDVLTRICNKIWQTGDWPTLWTQSLIITLPKKGNLQQCQNYRTISLICHASKVMLKVLLLRNPKLKKSSPKSKLGSVVEEAPQSRFSTYESCVKTFDRVWHESLWATTKKYNMGQKLIQTIKQLYTKASSAVLLQGVVGDWFHTTVGVRQGCLLSPTLFNIFLERIITDALENDNGTVSIGGRNITNLRFADDIDGLAGNEDELANLVSCLDDTSRKYGMEISAGKTKLMTNSTTPFTRNIVASGQQLDTVKQLKYLGAIISEEGSKAEVLARNCTDSRSIGKAQTNLERQQLFLPVQVEALACTCNVDLPVCM
ncbi:endonuclease-reverse transcriptase [Apostichopus japonicus]|uniref:Endonuclease-reverse transcriptase n=1 Tax=Stichopus japonicus TaxID=307972 RepID=A0A2G8K709_STIJA|nr:endonuclease-reverse transcriptase [Apostichopus japonicus]